MQASELLTVLAEISIALAGFTGIVVALLQRGMHELLDHEMVRLRFMLGVACELLFFALLPFLFHYMNLAPALTWSLSSGLLSAGLVATSVMGYHQSRDSVLSSSIWTPVYIWGGLVFSVITSMNAAAVPLPPGPAPYLAALGWLLFFSTSLFVRLVLGSRAPAPSPPQDEQSRV